MRQSKRFVLALSLLAVSGCVHLPLPYIEQSFDHRVRALERRGEKLDRELDAYIQEMNELRKSASQMHNSAEATATRFRGLLEQASGELAKPVRQPPQGRSGPKQK